MTEDLALEIKRQFFHLTLGIFITAGVWLLKPIYGRLILIPLIAAVVLMIIAPKILSTFKLPNHLSNQLLFHFERRDDIKKFPFKGAIWYGIGLFFPIMFLPLKYACAVIIILSVGDSVSTLAGKTCGKHKIGDKSIEGFFAFVFSGFLAAKFFLPPCAAFSLAVSGGLLELVDFFDDNLIVPLGLTVAYLVV